MQAGGEAETDPHWAKIEPAHGATVRTCGSWADTDSNEDQATWPNSDLNHPSSRAPVRCGTAYLRAVQFHPHGGSIRFRLALRTCGAPPCGPPARVVPGRRTKSRKIPTRKTFTLFFSRHVRGADGLALGGCAPPALAVGVDPAQPEARVLPHRARGNRHRGLPTRERAVVFSRWGWMFSWFR